MADRGKRARDEAAPLTATLNAAVARAARDGVYTPPPGVAAGRRRRRPASLRHLAEVITTHQLAPGYSVDKDVVGAVLAGNPRYLAEAPVVVAVAHAAHLIAGVPFTDADTKRLTVAADYIASLAAESPADIGSAPNPDPAPSVVEESAQPSTTISRRPPSAVLPHRRSGTPVVLDAYAVPSTPARHRRRWPVAAAALGVLLAAGVFLVLREDETVPEAACADGTDDREIVMATPQVFRDDDATRLEPNLDFDAMNGSARYARHQGRTYYWGRAGSDDATPFAGGSRVKWRIADGPWHSCATPLPVAERGYVHSPAVPTTIGGRPVTIQVCLWREAPRRENCTAEIRTG